MPKNITIEEDEYFFDRHKEKFLMKRSAKQPLNQELVYESEIGDFKDLFFRNEVLTARTSNGWFFSKDKGKTWLTEEEAEIDELINLQRRKCDVSFAVNYLSTAIDNYLKLNGSISFSVEERIKSNNTKCVELITLKDDSALDQFFKENLQLNSAENPGIVLIFPKLKKGLIEKTLLDNKVSDKKFVRKRILESIDNNFYFVPDFGVENLYLFYYNIMRYKQTFDVKTIVIQDLMQFFKFDKEIDFISSTLNMLCETAKTFDVRFVTTYSKNAFLNEEAMEFISKFNHPLIDQFSQIDHESDLILQETIKHW